MIFITEGQSAAGSIVSCRDVNTQAIFALRGKPLNVCDLQRDVMYKNEELYNLMRSLDIEIQLPSEQDAGRAMEALYAFTQCQMQIASRIVIIRENKLAEMDVPAILCYNTARLVEILRRELTRKRRRLGEEIHHQTLVRLFVENRVYQRIEDCDSSETVLQAVLEGLQPYRGQLQRDVTHEDADMLLGIPIRRISLFDLEKNRKEVERLGGELAAVEQDLGALVPYVIRYLRALLRKYGAAFPRRTRLKQFGEISERELTANELRIAYDTEKGYIGSKVAGAPLLSWPPAQRRTIPTFQGKPGARGRAC